MSDTVTVKLAKPVTHNETSFSELTFREPTVGDLILGDRETTQLAKMTTILASISETPLPAFKKISAKDFKAVVAAPRPLWETTRRTRLATDGRLRGPLRPHLACRYRAMASR